MKCFSVTEDTVTPNIAVTTAPYPHIGVGEEGRGRKYTRFPVAHRFAETLGENARIERASVLRTRERGTLLLVEEKDSADRRALVLVDIAAGFRGSTTWTSADQEVQQCRYRRKRQAELYCPECGVGYPATQDNSLLFKEENIHPDTGEVYVYTPFPPTGITVLAEGYCAQGEAGRMGGHIVRLLIMEPGVVFRVERHGRLYGEPSERFVYWDGETLRLGTRDEIFPPSCETADGDVI